MLLNATLGRSQALASRLVDKAVPAHQRLVRGQHCGRAPESTKTFGKMRRLLMSAIDQPLEM
jgi:hypothetical protein